MNEKLEQLYRLMAAHLKICERHSLKAAEIAKLIEQEYQKKPKLELVKTDGPSD